MPNWPITLAIVALPAGAPPAAAMKSHDVRATFVAADARTGAFTMSLDDGSRSSAIAEAEALRALRRLRAGDRIRVTCRNDRAGDRIAVLAINLLK